MSTKPLSGKKALIFGVANERSLGWFIAKHLAEQGADLAFTYLDERLERRVRPLADSVGSKIITQCDVAHPSQIEATFQKISQEWGSLDILIHSVAFADTKDLEGRFIHTSKEGFRIALEISAYSLVELARHAEPLFEKAGGGNVLTLTYHGSQKVVPNYNVMGVAKAALEASVRYLAYDMGSKKVRVNAISAGPIKTLAAMGIKNFKSMLEVSEQKVPLHENITGDDVGALAAFLCGPGGVHVTGTTLYVDSGSHIL